MKTNQELTLKFSSDNQIIGELKERITSQRISIGALFELFRFLDEITKEYPELRQAIIDVKNRAKSQESQ